MAEETQSKDQKMRVYHAYSSLVGKFSFLKLQPLLQSQCIAFIYLEYNKEIMTQNKHVLTWSNIYSLYSQNRDSQKTEKTRVWNQDHKQGKEKVKIRNIQINGNRNKKITNQEIDKPVAYVGSAKATKHMMLDN